MEQVTNPNPTTSKFQFPNLNGLRFIAAALVIIHHVEQFKHFLGLPNYKSVAFVDLIGKASVVLFFVLSGFLITYLLLVEEQRKGTISIKNFYIRRTLRIWPLYFFIVLAAFFILPYIPFLHIPDLSEQLHDHFWTKLLLYVFFLPNLVLGLYPLVPFASQLWTIGYEEQFYLIWPLLIKKIKNKNYIFFGIIFGFLIFKFLVLFVFDDYLARINQLKTAEVFFLMPSIDCMAIGGAFAYLLFRKKPILNWFFSKGFQIVLYASILVLVLTGTFIPFFNHQVYSVLCGLLILNLAANPKCLISLEYKPLDYLGKISYSIYMYHILVIVIVLKLLALVGINNVIAQNVISVGLTVAVASLSYKYLEEPFVKLKSKF